MSGKPIATLESISPGDIDSLAGKKVFFGHQSVGWNVIDGLADVAREKGRGGFAFVETRKPGDAPAFYHAGIGQNGDPLGKIADFEAIMDGGAGDKVDIALMKLCYVDVVAGTDVDAVFAAYRDAMKRLESKYPETTFIWVTVPLETKESGPRALAKRILGRVLRDDANIARRRINDMIRAESSKGNHPLFDIARIESLASDGTYAELAKGKERYNVLRDEYSSDGGHLNERGRLIAAMGLIESLAEAGRKIPAPRP